MLPFADQGRAGQDDGEHGDVVDEFHHRPEPRLGQVRIEAVARHDLDRLRSGGIVPVHERTDFVHDDLLDVAAAGERLRHARGVDVELDLRPVAGKDVLLEIVGDDQHERVFAVVHFRIDLGAVDSRCRQEHRREKGVGDAPGELRIVLIDHGQSRIRDGVRGGRRRDVDAEREGIENQRQHQRVPHQSPEFLQTELKNVFDLLPDGGAARFFLLLHPHASCFLKTAMPSPRMIGTITSMQKNGTWRSEKFSALLNTPRLMSSM